MSNYYAQQRSAKTGQSPTGVYFGKVTRVDSDLNRVWVEISRLARGFQFGPLAVIASTLPVVGDRVACQFMEEKSNDLIVLGVVKSTTSLDYVIPVVCTSSFRPENPPAGTLIFETNTFNVLVWNGSSWGGVEGGLNVFGRTATYGEDPESQFYEVTSSDLGALLRIVPDASESPSSPLVEITIEKGVGSVGSRIEFVHDLFSTGSFAFGLSESADALFLPPTGKLAAPRDSGSLVVATKVYENVEVFAVFVDVWLLSGDLADDL